MLIGSKWLVCRHVYGTQLGREVTLTNSVLTYDDNIPVMNLEFSETFFRMCISRGNEEWKYMIAVPVEMISEEEMFLYRMTGNIEKIRYIEKLKQLAELLIVDDDYGLHSDDNN